MRSSASCSLRRSRRPKSPRRSRPRKPEPAKPSAGKSDKATKQTAQRRSKPVKQAAKAKRGKKPAADDDDDEDEKPAKPALTGDLAILKNVIDLTREGETDDAAEAAKTIADPAGQKLAEWIMLRHSESDARFTRFVAYRHQLSDLAEQCADARAARSRGCGRRRRILRRSRRSLPRTRRCRPAAALRWPAPGLPKTTSLEAAREAKAAWRTEELGEATEEASAEEFKDLLAREDHRARMDKRIGAKELGAAMRAAKKLGDDYVAIVKACSAVKGDADKALSKLNDVPEDARADLGYVLCRVKWAMKKDKIVEAAKMVISAAPETMAQQDTDEWWRDRRTLSRKLLDMGEFQMAYDVVKDAARPVLEAYQAD